MRIVIDMQGAQSEFSGSRGVGRYARELTKALINNLNTEDEVFLALNGKLNCNSILSFFEGLIERENIKIWHYYPEVKPLCLVDDLESRPEELFREWFIHQLNADIIWNPNLQEGYGEANISISTKKTFGNEVVFSTLHDVTPLLYEEDYLNSGIRPWYMSKIKYACDSDAIITDSFYSKNKISEILNVPLQKIHVISLGYNDKYFYKNENYLSYDSKSHFFLYVGGADKHKNLERLIESFAKFKLSGNSDYQLFLAGKEPLSNEKNFKDCIIKNGLDESSVVFLGLVSDDELRELMQKCAAFIFPSFSEGFGLPPLEAMACGAPTLAANATSLTEIIDNPDALFNPYSVEELSGLMTKVTSDADFCNSLIESGISRAQDFSWDKASKELLQLFKNYAENNVAKNSLMHYNKRDLCEDLSKIFYYKNDKELEQVAYSIEHSTLFNPVKHIYIDTSAVVLEEYVSGIQRVVNGLISGFKNVFSESGEYEIKAVYSRPNDNNFYYSKYNGEKYISRFTEGREDIVEFYDGDILIMPDLHPENIITKKEYLHDLTLRGVKVVTSLNDIIPIQYPDFFSKDFVKQYKEYMKAIANFSGIVSISKATMNSYLKWCEENDIEFPPYFFTDYYYLGSDIAKANPSKGLPENASEIINCLKKQPTILMVGTIEPRKKQDQILKAVEELWNSDENVNLVFVGRNGWQMNEFVDKLNSHKQNGKSLFWLSGISDEFLEMIYELSSGVIVASLEEGYGLPIIEAAYYGKPLLLRDIPVFNEVAGDNACYFKDDAPDKLAVTIKKWLLAIRDNSCPSSKKIKYLTWDESAESLFSKIKRNDGKINKIKSADLDSVYNAIDYKHFERNFRGDSKVISIRQKQYIKYFANCNKVLDIGSGRGEFLTLLKENGIGAEGVDLCDEFVNFSRANGLKVTKSDGIEYIKSSIEWDGIFSSQLIEHLDFDRIMRLCSEAYFRLKKGSYLILETPNPTKLCTFSSFYLDPSHQKPIHPGTMQYIFEKLGFEDVKIIFTEESKYSYNIPMIKSNSIDNLEEINRAMFVLNDFIFGSMDYAIVGRK